MIPSDYESLKNEIVWRVVSMRTYSGGMSGFAHTEYLHDDRVLTSRLGDYLKDINERSNVTKITLHRIGPLKDAWDFDYSPHPGTTSFTKSIRKMKKLESFV